jgi:hypothetical protein
VAYGVTFKEIPPDNAGAHHTGNSVPRENHAFWTDGAGLGSPSGRGGAGLVRSLEASAFTTRPKVITLTAMCPRPHPLYADGLSQCDPHPV